ncbi:MAG: hypothetical protein Kow0080_03160 [Candidatus Promineifilaceae bacterium]
MNIDPYMDLDTLTAVVARRFSQMRRLVFAAITPELIIARHSENFTAVTSDFNDTVSGQLLTNVFPEFVGSEEAIRAVLNGEKQFFRLSHINRQDTAGELHYLSFEIRPLDKQTPNHGLLLTIEDTTEIGKMQQWLVQERNELRMAEHALTQANEKLEQLNQMKSIFLAIAAHDMRTPLTAIYGYADFILERKVTDDPFIQKAVGVIKAQAEHLKYLVEDFLNLDQIQQGKLVITPQQVHLGETLTKVQTTLRVLQEAREITLQIDLPPQDVWLFVDQNKFMQILYNLVGNAIKYTPKGGRVHISTELEASHKAVIRIADTGSGMSEEEVSQLFSLYYRTDDARKSKTSGAGLGLYIVKMLVEAHGGQIDVDSRWGKGTTFIVRLPLAQTETAV